MDAAIIEDTHASNCHNAMADNGLDVEAVAARSVWYHEIDRDIDSEAVVDNRVDYHRESMAECNTLRNRHKLVAPT